jgi:hypothetical protein
MSENDNLGFIKTQLTRYRDLLANFSRKNKELYFTPSKKSAICMSSRGVVLTTESEEAEGNPSDDESDSRSEKLSAHAEVSERQNEDAPEAMETLGVYASSTSQMFTSGSLDLNDYFKLTDVRRQPLIKYLEKIKSDDVKYQKEFGISGAWLLGPFILWRDKPEHRPEDILISPLFKFPININSNRRRNWVLEVEDSSFRLTPSLQLALEKLRGIKLPTEYEAEKFSDAVEEVCRAIARDGRTVEIVELSGNVRLFDESGGHLYAPGLNNDALSEHVARIRETFSSKGATGIKLPKLLAKTKKSQDESGAPSRVPTSIETDLPELDQNWYKATTYSNFMIVDCFYIDHIPATRMPLFKDYEQVYDDLENHPIVSELLGKQLVVTRSDRPPLPRELDEYKERDNFFVINTDSSQHGAIDRVSKESAIVIQGPPGTGKSQTITNLIATQIAEKKTVLFVAEKRAALDVVYTRLQKAGIDKQAVLMHSSDVNKKALYESFLELANVQPQKEDEHAWVYVADKLDREKSELHKYYDTANLEFRNTGLKISDICAMFASLEEGESIDSQTSIGRFFSSKLNGLTLPDVVNDLNRLQELFLRLPNYISHPWRYKKQNLVASADLRSQLESIREEVTQIVKRLESLKKAKQQALPGLVGWTGAEDIRQLITKLEEISSADWKVEGAKELADTRTFQSSHLQGAFQLSGLVEEIAKSLGKVKELWPSARQFKMDADEKILASMIEYFSVPRPMLAPFMPSYWKAKRICKSIMKPEEFENINFKSLDERPFKSFQAFKLEFERFSALLGLSKLFSCIKDAHSQADQLIDAAQSRLDDYSNILAINEFVCSLGLDQMWRSMLASNVEISRITERCRQYCVAREEEDLLLAKTVPVSSNLSQYFDRSEHSLAVQPHSVIETIERLLNHFNECETVDAINAECQKFVDRWSVGGFMEELAPIFLETEARWGDVAHRQILRIWYDEVRTDHPSFRIFDRLNFETKIQNFRVTEETHRASATAAVQNLFAVQWSSERADPNAIALLRRESTKQKKIMYPREIMEKGALKTMLRLKPCWLMSPLSISQILPLVKGLFDIIIFDEASQVRVEDAIPSIYRAKKMVVVGDPKQMPPTNFFVGGADDEDDDADADEPLAESILDLSAKIYPAQMLEWHYRSRSESLIAFSNRAFYGGRLIAAPNCKTLGMDGAITFNEIKDATFNDKKGNVVEAKAVIECLAKELQKNPNNSFGIIAMGMAQRNALEDALTNKISQDEGFAEKVRQAEGRTEGQANVGLFIKNLENVQGDERDIMLISVGYAPSKPGVKLRMHFGPLSNRGGSRRLNVAITRARAKMVVFTSFPPETVPSDEEAFSNNAETATFGRFLKYAKAVSKMDSQEAERILNSFGMAAGLTTRKASRFSLDVARRLADRGHMVSKEIGTCGFVIDIGVHHPNIPGNFILGIECDGAVFHSTPYARDRDKAREALLVGRGWRIIRVFSADWSRNWQAEVARLEQEIETIKKAC